MSVVAPTSPADALASIGAPGVSTFLDGEFVDGGADVLALTYPGTGTVLGEVRATSLLKLDAALTGAVTAAASWAAADSHSRAAVLVKVAQLLRRDRSRLATAITLDVGKTAIEANREVGAAALLFRQAAAFAPHLEGSTFPVDRGLVRFTWREPYGVVAAIIPFNAPLLFAALKLAPALAAGNTVILKSPEQTPLVPVLLAQVLHEAGLPPGVVQVILGGADVGSALVEDDRVAMVSLTGGTDTGRRVMATAAAGPKPVLLELGGKSANIVFDDADLDKAVAGAMAGVFADAGQRCFSGTRLLVQRPLADAFIGRLSERTARLRVGDPLGTDVDVGPVIGHRTVDRVAAACVDAVSRGATTIEHPGDLPECGTFVKPTLVVGPTADALAWRQELFAPVAVIETFDDDAEGIALANDSDFGLAGGCWTSSLGRALYAARHVTTGYFWVNAYSALTFEAPFGGTKHSGVGSEFGRRGVEAYTREKTVSIDMSGGDTARVFEID